MLSSLFSKQEKAKMSWKVLDDVTQLEEINRLSIDKPILVFKHSTSCPISAMVLNRFEKSYKEEDASFEAYYLDLIVFRGVSNEIANKYGVHHKSPQVLLIEGGQAIYTSSHIAITYEEVNEKASKV